MLRLQVLLPHGASRCAKHPVVVWEVAVDSIGTEVHSLEGDPIWHIAVGVLALQVSFLAICVKVELEGGRLTSTFSN